MPDSAVGVRVDDDAVEREALNRTVDDICLGRLRLDEIDRLVTELIQNWQIDQAADIAAQDSVIAALVVINRHHADVFDRLDALEILDAVASHLATSLRGGR